jgi:hypothetical protein
MIDGMSKERVMEEEFDKLTPKQKLARNELYTIECINEAIDILQCNGGKYIVECVLRSERDKCEEFIANHCS